MIRIIFFLAALFILTSTTQGTTYYVPDDYPTIQAAINASADGDTVIVRPGTYVENIDFVGKAITVKSEKGATVTSIDGSQSGSVAVFQNGEDKDSVLDGFTLTNGTGTPNLLGHYVGGGIYCNVASPIINNNVITGNTVAQFGGGIRCEDSCAPTITNNTITWNSGGNGGGISCWGYTSPIIKNNLISVNTAYGTTQYSGGGIFCDFDSNSVITNNIISGNLAYGNGGGIGCVNSSPIISNNIITENSADGNSGGICCSDGSSMTITNTILWDNSAPNGIEIRIGSKSGPSTLTISYTDLDGGRSSISIALNCTLNWGVGMIDADPLFVDEVNGDFHLTFTSPCKDTGDNTAVTELTDFEGDLRIAYGTVDMGADEFYTHLYHTGDATPGGTVQIKFVGVPNTAPLALCVGTGVLDNAIQTNWGTWWNEWWLKFPIVGPIDLGSIPSPDGVYVLPATLPPTVPGPYSIPMQAFIGDSLTNVCVMEVN
jgi:parallel beta-helix repeat protein